MLNDLRKRLRLPRVFVYYDVEEKASKSCVRLLAPAQFMEGELQRERRL